MEFRQGQSLTTTHSPLPMQCLKIQKGELYYESIPFLLPLKHKPLWVSVLLLSLLCVGLSCRSTGLEPCWEERLVESLGGMMLSSLQRKITFTPTSFLSLRGTWEPASALSLCVHPLLVQNSGKEEGCYPVVLLYPNINLREWKRGKSSRSRSLLIS